MKIDNRGFFHISETAYRIAVACFIAGAIAIPTTIICGIIWLIKHVYIK